MLRCTRYTLRVVQTKVLNNVDSSLAYPQAMNALTVRAPRIVVITLLGIEAWALKHLPGER